MDPAVTEGRCRELQRALRSQDSQDIDQCLKNLDSEEWPASLRHFFIDQKLPNLLYSIIKNPLTLSNRVNSSKVLIRFISKSEDLEILVDVIKIDDLSVKGHAMEKMTEIISENPSYLAVLFASRPDILTLLISVAQQGYSDAQFHSSDFAKRIVQADFALQLLTDIPLDSHNLDSRVDMYEVAVSALSLSINVTEERKLLGLRLLSSYSTEALKFLTSSQAAILNVIKSTIQDESQRVRIAVLKLLALLSRDKPLQHLIGADSVILQGIVSACRNIDDDNTVEVCLKILYDLTWVDETRTLLLSPVFGWLALLAQFARHTSSGVRRNTVNILVHYAYIDKYRVQIAAAEFGILRVLVELLTMESGDGLNNVLNALVNLSNEKENLKAMVSRDLGLLEVLVDVLTRERLITAIVKTAVDVLLNLVIPAMEARRDQERITRPSFGLVKCLTNILVYDSGPVRDQTIGVLWNIAEEGTALEVQDLIDFSVHQTVLTFIRAAGPDRTCWGDGNTDFISRGLNFIMNLARHEVALKPLRSIGTVEVMKEILLVETNGCECLKAMFVVAFLVGRDEAGSKSSLATSALSARPETIRLLVDVLRTVLDSENGVDYPLGTFCLKLTVRACLVMAQSDSNKAALVDGPLLNLLKRVLDSFVRRDPAIYLCGGGGDDNESAELAIETILQLSFFYEDDLTKLGEQLMSPESGIFDVMCDLHNPEHNSRLSPEADRNVSLMLSRLRSIDPSSPRGLSSLTQAGNYSLDSELDGIDSSSSSESELQPDAVAMPVPPRPRAHVMMSYCWKTGAFPERVKLLTAALRVLGLDVWRDEDGSNLLGPLSGSVDESMAAALEAASVVIVCVSREYKLSPNCRMESNYASHLFKKGKLQIIYVMMQSDYTPHSPESCDGWLGIRIGTLKYYELTRENRDTDVARELYDAIEDKERVVMSTTFSQSVGRAPAISSISRTPSSMDSPNPSMSLQRHESTISQSSDISDSSQRDRVSAVLQIGDPSGAGETRSPTRTSIQEAAPETPVALSPSIDCVGEGEREWFAGGSGHSDRQRLEIPATAAVMLALEVQQRAHQREIELLSELHAANSQVAQHSATQVWSLLHDSSVAKEGRAADLAQLLGSHGLTSKDDLQYCSDDFVMSVMELLRPVPAEKLRRLLVAIRQNCG